MVTILVIFVAVIFICVLIACVIATNSADNVKVFDLNDRNNSSTNDQASYVGNKLPSEINCKVKGTSFRSPDEIAAARFCNLGDTLILEPEPDNDIDPYAVKVLTMEGVHIGYVEASYSEQVFNNIDHVSQCRISRKTQHDIPYIDISIKFSEDPVSQHKFIQKEYQCGPEDVMRNLSKIDVNSYKYRRVPLMLEGLYEHDRPTIAKIRAARKGDKVILKKGECNDFYQFRVDAYLEDGTYIGYGDEFTRYEVYSLFDNIVESMIGEPIGSDAGDNLCIYVFFPNGLQCQDSPFFRTNIISYYKGAYQEVKYAMNIRVKDPGTALDILLPIADKEKGIAAKIECIACYYTLKDWSARIDMINRTLRHIDSLTEEDFPISELRFMNQHIIKLTKQLEYSQKRLDSQMKKMK